MNAGVGRHAVAARIRRARLPKRPLRNWFRAESASCIRPPCGSCVTRISPRKPPRRCLFCWRKRRDGFRAGPSSPAGFSKRHDSSPWLKCAPAPSAANASRRPICKPNFTPPRPIRSGTNLAPAGRSAALRWAKDRQAVLLRFFENKSLGGGGRCPWRRRGHRPQARQPRAGQIAKTSFETGCEFHRRHYCRRQPFSPDSVQVPPVALAKSVTAIALAKGAAASGSTLTIVKGALKIMAWTKVKTAIVASVGVLLVAGSTTVTVKEIEEHRPYSWQLPHFVAKNFNDASDMLQSILEQTRAASANCADHSSRRAGHPCDS